MPPEPGLSKISQRLEWYELVLRTRLYILTKKIFPKHCSSKMWTVSPLVNSKHTVH